MIRETVSRPIIGKMRMQFWKDAIDSIAKVSLDLLAFILIL